MDTLDHLWERLDVGLPALTGEPLAPGAARAAITHVERLLGVPFPEDVTTSYQRHNGGYSIQLATLMTILPVDDVAAWWQILEELRHDDDWARQPPYYFSEEALRLGPPYPGPIQPVWWHQRWIPIAADLGGNLSCVDLVPAPGGIVGQIIDWDHECGPSRVLFPSFTHLLAGLADEVEERLKR